MHDNAAHATACPANLNRRRALIPGAGRHAMHTTIALTAMSGAAIFAAFVIIYMGFAR
jgi:hypothetical protein